MKRRSTLQYDPRLSYSVDLRTLTYTEPVPLKSGKLATNHPWIIGYFYSAGTDRQTAIIVDCKHVRFVSGPTDAGLDMLIRRT